MSKINIGTEFSDDPCGRFYTDGQNSAEAFREEYLWPELKKLKGNEKLTVIMDDQVEAYGASFLMESFAGIVKFGYMSADQLLNRLDFEYTDNDFAFYKACCLKYITEAKFKSRTYHSSRAA